jgi:hypothetical protein
MKSSITCIVLILFFLAAFLYAEVDIDPVTQSIAGFNIEFSSQPEEDGNLTKAKISYRHNRKFSSSARARVENSTDVGDMEDAGFTDSLLVSRENNFIIDLYPLEYNTSLGPLPLKLGAGLNITRTNRGEKGHFEFNPDQTSEDLINNIFDNDSRVIFYAPTFTLDTRYQTPQIKIRYNLYLTPVYLFSFTQDLRIEPLVSTTGTNKFSSWGIPFVENDIKLTVLRFFQAEVNHSYQKLNFEGLTPNGTLDGWETYESKSQVSVVTFIGNIIIPSKKSQGEITVGIGMKKTNTNEETEGESTTVKDSKIVFNLGFSGL